MGKRQGRASRSERRRVLCGMCALGLPVPVLAQSGDPAASLPPQPDDLLVFAYGERAGQPVRVSDLEAGAKQLFAYPMEPGSALIRNGSRLNQVLLVRLEPARLAAHTAARAVEGVVAYSGVCTHTGCDVTDWNAEFQRFQCPCHESQFDPGDGARVVGGPAPRQLAALPLKLSEGLLTVAAEFEGRVGFDQPGGLGSPFGI